MKKLVFILSSLLLMGCGEQYEKRIVCDSGLVTQWFDYRGNEMVVSEGVLYYGGVTRKMLEGEICWRENRIMEK